MREPTLRVILPKVFAQLLPCLILLQRMIRNAGQKLADQYLLHLSVVPKHFKQGFSICLTF